MRKAASGLLFSVAFLSGLEIDIKTFVSEILVNTYARHKGRDPEGSFLPNDEVTEALLGVYKKNLPALKQFLQLAMFAHMYRTETTRTPFRVNSMLLAPDFVDFIEKRRKYLLQFYGSETDACQFEKWVYGCVLASELDFLDIRVGELRKPHAFRGESESWSSFISPSFWWLFWSEEFKRKFDTIPDKWLSAKQPDLEGKRRVASDMFNQYKASLRQNKQTLRIIANVAAQAIQEAAGVWCARAGLLRPVYLEDGGTRFESVLLDRAAIEWTVSDWEAGVSLSQRDKCLFEQLDPIIPKTPAPETPDTPETTELKDEPRMPHSMKTITALDETD